MDHLANKKIKLNKPLVKNKILGVRGYHTNMINPLKNDIIVCGSCLSAMDIETIKFNGDQTPIAISLAYGNNQTKLFLIE